MCIAGKVNKQQQQQKKKKNIWAWTRENVPSPMCTQERLKSACVSTQTDQSPMSAWRNFASLAIQNVPSDDSDQTA